MSDRLYQSRSQLPLDAAHPESIADEIVATIRALEDQAETRPFPVALNWSEIRILTSSTTVDGRLAVTASAPVL